MFSDDVVHFCLDIAWIGLLPVEESEPVFASPSGEDCTNAWKEEFYIITKCAILLKLIQQCYSTKRRMVSRKIYQKQKTAIMATRIGFFTFFKLGWSNKVERTPWGAKIKNQLNNFLILPNKAERTPWAAKLRIYEIISKSCQPPWCQSGIQDLGRGACRRRDKTRWEPQESEF